MDATRIFKNFFFFFLFFEKLLDHHATTLVQIDATSSRLFDEATAIESVPVVDKLVGRSNDRLDALRIIVEVERHPYRRRQEGDCKISL